MHRLLRRLVFGGRGLREYERNILTAFRGQLGTEARTLLDRQLEMREIVQRQWGGKIVTFLYGEGGQDRDDATIPTFPNRDLELTVAVTSIHPAGQGRPLRCRVVFNNGRLAALEFAASPKPLSRAGAQVDGVQMLADIMAATVPPRPVPRDAPLLDRVRALTKVDDVVGPKGDEEITRHLTAMAAQVPADYISLLHETNGFRAGGWQFFGTGAWSIVHPAASYFLVAANQGSDEGNPRSLCFREGNPEARVLLYDHVMDEFIDRGGEFMPVLLQVLRT